MSLKDNLRKLRNDYKDNKPLLNLIYWRKIRVTDGLGPKAPILKEAIVAAENNKQPSLPAFAFTESLPEWVLLYNLVREGQISPKILKNMRRADLYYIAGHTFPHPALTRPKDKEEFTMYKAWLVQDDPEQRWDQVTKIQGNAARAKMELERRNFIWASIFTVLAALLGGLLSGQILK